MISNPVAAPETPLAPIRLLGGLAVAAGFTNAVADYALRGGPRPVSGAAISLEMLGSVPHESIWFGSLLGAAVMPLWILGLFPVYVGLRPAGRWWAALPVFLFGYGICVASGYHGSYALYGSGFALQAALPEATDVSRHLDHLMQHHDGLQAVFVAPWIIGSVSFVVIVLTGRTGFPRWMAFTSPILVPLIVTLSAGLPAPLGGYIRPGIGSLTWTLFFAMALWLTWNGVDQPVKKR